MSDRNLAAPTKGPYFSHLPADEEIASLRAEVGRLLDVLRRGDTNTCKDCRWWVGFVWCGMHRCNLHSLTNEHLRQHGGIIDDVFTQPSFGCRCWEPRVQAAAAAKEEK